MLRRTPLLARDAELGALLETFFVVACTTVIVIRTQLWLTNYPQLGGGGLHIAHLLWGGVFMVLAIGLLLVYLSRAVRRPAAIIGGVGFGFFIDELGKFITSDNNYFFKPAAALIYLIFVGLFLAIRALQRRRGLSPMEEVANAIDLIAQAAGGELSDRDQQLAVAHLDRADPADPLVAPLRALLRKLQAVPTPEPSRTARLVLAFRARVAALAATPRFVPAVTAVLLVWGALSLVTTVELVLSIAWARGGDDLGSLTVVNWASLASSTASGLFVVSGARALRAGRHLDAYYSFERAVLIAIFVTRTFAFVESQFGAVFGLGIDLLLLVSLRVVMREAEERTSSVAATGTDPAPRAVPVG